MRTLSHIAALFAALCICTFTANAQNNANPDGTTAAENLSRDPYDGKGTAQQYAALSNEWKAKALKCDSGAIRLMEAAVKATNMVTSKFSSLSQKISWGATAAKYTAQAKTAMDNAKKARAEAKRYAELSKKANYNLQEKKF